MNPYKNPLRICHRVSFSSNISYNFFRDFSKNASRYFSMDLPGQYSRDFFRNTYKDFAGIFQVIHSGISRGISPRIFLIFFWGFPLNLQEESLDEYLKECLEHLGGFPKKSLTCFIATYFKISLEEFFETSRHLGGSLLKSQKNS